jgi:hypothetical protein
MRKCFVLVAGLLLALGWVTIAPAGQPSPTILVLGDAAFINDASVRQATGAAISRDPGTPLQNVAVLVLANIALSSLPQPIQSGLVDYVSGGGALLMTGGAQSFGSGGYTAVAPIIPFEIRSDSDWRFITFRPPVPVQPGHPILAGVTFITIGTVNDMNPRPGAIEILQSAGGGVVGLRAGGGRAGGGSYPYPLIAEVMVGSGRVVGVAFDMNDLGGMRDRDLFVQNTLTYLLATSRR